MASPLEPWLVTESRPMLAFLWALQQSRVSPHALSTHSPPTAIQRGLWKLRINGERVPANFSCLALSPSFSFNLFVYCFNAVFDYLLCCIYCEQALLCLGVASGTEVKQVHKMV